MTSEPTQAPVLSTPDTHIFEDPTPAVQYSSPRYSDEELWEVYEIKRTAREVRNGAYRRVALQFPDQMLRDAPRVVEVLQNEVERIPAKAIENGDATLETRFNDLAIAAAQTPTGEKEERIRFYILGDTSYGSCCVDEIAAEHADADAVVHYGRSCLSPTARLPVIYIFTSHPLDIPFVSKSFEATFPSKDEKVVLMADITYNVHIPAVAAALSEKGYMNIVTPEVIHDPSSIIPNRKVEEEVKEKLGEYSLFHISDPPPALLLTLSSRVKAMFIYPTTTSSLPNMPITPEAQSSRLLRRRYGLLTSLTTCPIFGILINTLSVKNYLSTVSQIQSLITHSGKKSYTFVVGKVNAAKIANFSEIGGWVVVGCWESSLVESGEFYRPLITPFELALALQRDGERVWDGSWVGDFGSVKALSSEPAWAIEKVVETKVGEAEAGGEKSAEIQDDSASDPESAPPEFDLRTGRYVSHTRPMATHTNSNLDVSPSNGSDNATSSGLIKRVKGELATINGAVSPGAEYLRSQRTWTGLGSDFIDEKANESIEEGRSGVARGYVVGEGGERR